MKAIYSDSLYTNDDITPMLTAKNHLLVAVQPDNEDEDYYIINGREYGIFVLNPEYQKLAVVLGRIAVIHPVSQRGRMEGMNVEDKSEI